jgi:hypothetical protein
MRVKKGEEKKKSNEKRKKINSVIQIQNLNTKTQNMREHKTHNLDEHKIKKHKKKN